MNGLHAQTLSEPHLPEKKGRSRCHAKSPGVQDTLQPIIDLTVCITCRPARESLMVHAWMVKWVHLANGTVAFV